MSSNNEFAHESFQDCQSIVKYLTAIGEGFANGHIRFANGNRPMELEPSGMLKFNVRAKRKDGHIKLSLKISWKEQGEEVERAPLKIEPKHS